MRYISGILKNSFAKVASLVAVPSVAIGIGWRKHGASPVPTDHHLGHESTPAHGGHGHHPFTDPEGLAAKFNDPKRDEWQHPQEIIAALALKPGATVADIGAGTGYMVAHLSKAVGERGTVIAIDASAAMIEYLSARSGDLGPAMIIPRKVGYDSPDLNMGSVDGVLTLDTWHHVGGREVYAKEVYAGLKHGGRFVVVDYNFDAADGPPLEIRLKAAQVSEELEAARFRVETVCESMPSHFMVVGRKI
jgi:predicted methyltransferase